MPLSRFRRSLVIFVALMAAACGGGSDDGAPTQVGDDDTEVPSADSTANADDDDPPEAPGEVDDPGPATFRLAHFWFTEDDDAPAVDVYASTTNGLVVETLLASDVAYGTVTDYEFAPPNPGKIKIWPAGTPESERGFTDNPLLEASTTFAGISEDGTPGDDGLQFTMLIGPSPDVRGVDGTTFADLSTGEVTTFNGTPEGDPAKVNVFVSAGLLFDIEDFSGFEAFESDRSDAFRAGDSAGGCKADERRLSEGGTLIGGTTKFHFTYEPGSFDLLLMERNDSDCEETPAFTVPLEGEAGDRFHVIVVPTPDRDLEIVVLELPTA